MRLNERRQAQAAADLADEHEVVGSGIMAYMQGTPWICKAVGVDLDGALKDDDVARIVEYFHSRGAAPALELTGYSREATFAAAARAGFALAEVEHVLSRVPADLDVPLPDGIRIERLDAADPAAMRRHAEIVCSGFPPPDGRVPEPVLESALRSQRHPNTMGFFACLDDGTRVAASGMEVATLDPGSGDGPARVLALWGTTVLPAYRRRGIQQALIAHRLRVGRERGCEVAVIESRPGISTERNAARLGFGLTYVRLMLKARG